MGDTYITINNDGYCCGEGFVAGGDLSGSETDQTVVGIRNVPVSATTPTTDQVLEYNGTEYVPTNLPNSLPPNGEARGDLDEYYPGPTVVGIQNIAVPVPANDGYVLTYNAGTYLWSAVPSQISGLYYNIITVTSDYVIDSGMYPDTTVNVAEGYGVNITLPAPTFGRVLFVKGSWDGYVSTLYPHASEMIDYYSSLTLTTGNSYHIQSDGINWFLISKS